MLPFIIRENSTEEMQSKLRLTQDLWKPSLIIVVLRKVHSTLSKALLRSILITTQPFLPLTLFLMKWRHSCSIMTLSVMLYLGEKQIRS